jgi:hypothetical protein
MLPTRDVLGSTDDKLWRVVLRLDAGGRLDVKEGSRQDLVKASLRRQASITTLSSNAQLRLNAVGVSGVSFIRTSVPDKRGGKRKLMTHVPVS